MDKNIKIFETAQDLTAGAAQFIADKSAQSIKEKGRFSIALSGGSTPETLFKILAEAPYRDMLDWNKVFVFWSDERCVPLNDQRNNALMTKSLLLDKVNIPKANIHRIPSDLKPEKAAQAYEDTIRFFFKGSAPRFDLIILGMGEDGHTASLMPGSEVLHDSAHLVASLYVEKLDMSRVTMTADFINKAHEVLFLIAGEKKADMLNIILNGARDTDKYPAQMINPQDGGLYWYIDQDAASKLAQH